MNNILEYKDFKGSVEYSDEDDCLFGKILFIDDLILYEGNSLSELKKDFQDSVDEYIQDCKRLGKPLKKEFKGTFNIRITPELHEKIALIAQSKHKSINGIITEALERLRA